MKRRTHTTTKSFNRSFAANIVIGVIGAIIVSAALSALLTSLVINGNMGEEQGSYFVFAIRLLSVMVGCLLSAGLVKEKILPVIGLVAAGYLIVIVGLGIVLYNGSFQNFLSGVLSVLCGTVAATLIKLKAPAKRKHSMRRIK